MVLDLVDLNLVAQELIADFDLVALDLVLHLNLVALPFSASALGTPPGRTPSWP